MAAGGDARKADVCAAAELIIGNLGEDGYLLATDEELLGVAAPRHPKSMPQCKRICERGEALGIGAPIEGEPDELQMSSLQAGMAPPMEFRAGRNRGDRGGTRSEAPAQPVPAPAPTPRAIYKPTFTLSDCTKRWSWCARWIRRACLPRPARVPALAAALHPAAAHQQKNGNGTSQVLADAIAIVDQHLRAVQMKQHKEIAKAMGRPIEAVPPALEFIRTLDPRPGLHYNKATTRLIEPDVAFVKHGDEWLVMMNDDDVPQLRLNPAYKRLLTKDANDKDTRNYVKERYKSAIQLIKNIEQRKQTIMKVCYSIVARQQDFLEKGIDQLKPMMIKEVAEEIGVHPSTVSRAVANKYAHTPQGVFELRYFFSESVQGPEGGNTSLLILKRRVKKLIEEEDPARPLTDEQITRILQSQGIQVTRRTVAKYREDMRIPSTHQRRVKK